MIDPVEFEKHVDLVAFFRKEDELRASSRFQAEYERRDDLEWLDIVTDRIRMEILLSIGIEPTPDVMKLLSALRIKARDEGFGAKHGEVVTI